MHKIHVFGATSRLGRVLTKSLSAGSVREDRIYEGYMESDPFKTNDTDRKVLVILAWSGYPSSNSPNSEHENKSIINMALRLARKERYDHIVFTSSAGALYRENSSTMQCEEAETFVDSPYGKQKLAAETLLSMFCREQGIDLSILRITTAYGFSSQLKSQGVVTRWIDSVINGKDVELWINSRSAINFISYEQAADAIQRTIWKRFDGILNIGCSDVVQMRDVLDTIKSEAKRSGLPVRVRKFGDKVRLMCVDCTKSREILGKSYKSDLLNEIRKIFREMLMRKSQS